MGVDSTPGAEVDRHGDAHNRQGGSAECRDAEGLVVQQDPAHGRQRSVGGEQHGRATRPDPRYGRYYRPDRYYRAGYAPIRVDRRTRIYRGYDDRYYCRRSDGTTGLIVGAALGGLLGSQIDRGQSNIAGILIGGGAGALLGREIDRGGVSCR